MAKEPSKTKKKFNAEVAKLKKTLQEMCVSLELKKQDPNEWLRYLYTEYHNHALYNDGVIWKTGAIFLPVSLAVFPIFLSIDVNTIGTCKELLVTLSAFLSLSLVILWFIIAENLRAVTVKSLAWVKAIQEVIGLRDEGKRKLTLNCLSEMFVKENIVQRVRFVFTVMIAVFWAVLWFYYVFFVEAKKG